MMHYLIYILFDCAGIFPDNFLSITVNSSNIFSNGVIYLAIFIILMLIWNFQLFSKLKQYRKKLQVSEKMSREQERKIQHQQKLIEEQLLVRDEQNDLIHSQNIELEKHRHQLEKIVETRTNELIAAKEKAEESDRLKTSFLENISHEIRTPMNAIVGFSSLLQETTLTDEVKVGYIRRIQLNTQSLLKLIENILDMSKIQEGLMELSKTRFSLMKALKDLYQQFSDFKKDHNLTNIDFTMDFDDQSEDYFIYNDLSRFIQVMENLLSNAFKFTEKGYIRMGFIPVYASEFKNEPENIRFYVEDSGIGIPPGKSESIFELFTKLEEDKTKLYRGAGLGLYLSKNLVQMMGGRMWVHSNPREGSSFNFTLPFFNTEDNRTTEPKKKYRSKIIDKEFDWRNKTVLIAEDEQHNYTLLSEIIKKTGASILQAKNGKEAVETVKTNPSISLVLMDIMMPKMDGYEATREIKKIRPKLPVFAQTAYTEPRQKEKSLEAGCEGYILKPYNPPELLGLLDNFI